MAETIIHNLSLPRTSDGRLAKALLVVRGLTQYQIASAIGKSRGYISEILCGHVLPKREEAARIAEILGVQSELIFPKVREDRE